MEDLAFAEDWYLTDPHNPDPPRYSAITLAWLAICVNSGTAEAEFT